MRTIILHAIYAAIIISALYLAYDMGRFVGEVEAHSQSRVVK